MQWKHAYTRTLAPLLPRPPGAQRVHAIVNMRVHHSLPIHAILHCGAAFVPGFPLQALLPTEAPALSAAGKPLTQHNHINKLHKYKHSRAGLTEPILHHTKWTTPRNRPSEDSSPDSHSSPSPQASHRRLPQHWDMSLSGWQ